MKKLMIAPLSLVTILILITAGFNSAHAAPKSKKQSPTSAAPRSYERASDTTSYAEPTDLQMGATGSLGMVDGNFGFGVGFRIETPVKLENLNLMVGGETGIYRFGFTNGSLLVFPIVGTALYHIKLNAPSDVKLYARTGLGIDIALSKTDGTTVGATTVGGTSDTKVKFHFSLAPGVSFSDNQFFAELPFGTMAGGFLLMPTFGMHF